METPTNLSQFLMNDTDLGFLMSAVDEILGSSPLTSPYGDSSTNGVNQVSEQSGLLVQQGEIPGANQENSYQWPLPVHESGSVIWMEQQQKYRYTLTPQVVAPELTEVPQGPNLVHYSSTSGNAEVPPQVEEQSMNFEGFQGNDLDHPHRDLLVMPRMQENIDPILEPSAADTRALGQSSSIFNMPSVGLVHLNGVNPIPGSVSVAPVQAGSPTSTRRRRRTANGNDAFRLQNFRRDDSELHFNAMVVLFSTVRGRTFNEKVEALCVMHPQANFERYRTKLAYRKKWDALQQSGSR